VPQVALLYSTAGHYRSSPRLFHPSGSDGISVLRKALSALVGSQYAVQVLCEHHLAGSMSRWPLIVVPGWGYLEPAFRDELSAYVEGGGRLLLIGEGPADLFERELSAAGDAATAPIVSVADVDEAFPGVVRRLFPDPLVEVSGSADLDVSPRRLAGRLTVHLVNTAGSHANPPAEGVTAIPPIGPLTVAIRLSSAPRSVTLQPEGTPLAVSWSEGRASVTVPRLNLYSVLVVEE
jgi:hypothetical protein